jgi:hypothetical protein
MSTANIDATGLQSWGGPAAAAVMAAALGAAFGELSLTALNRSLSTQTGWIQIAVAAPIMYLASRHFLDPLSSGLRNALGLPPAPVAEDAPSGRGLWALAAGSAVMLVWLGNVLSDYAQAHPVAVLMTIGMSALLVGGMTLGWMVGARSALPLSGLLGLLAGFSINTVATMAILSFKGVTLTPDLVGASAMSGLSVGLAGLAGGVVIDARRTRRPALAATLAALAVFALTAMIAAWQAGDLQIALILPNIMLGIGWLLGLSSSPYANALLSRRTVRDLSVTG